MLAAVINYTTRFYPFVQKFYCVFLFQGYFLSPELIKLNGKLTQGVPMKVCVHGFMFGFCIVQAFILLMISETVSLLKSKMIICRQLCPASACV